MALTRGEARVDENRGRRTEIRGRRTRLRQAAFATLRRARGYGVAGGGGRSEVRRQSRIRRGGTEANRR
jgi:hypothetical protein